MKGDDGGNEPIQTVRNTKYIFLKIIERKHFKFCHALIPIYFVIVKVRSQNMIMLVSCLKKKTVSNTYLVTCIFNSVIFRWIRVIYNYLGNGGFERL